LPFAFYCDFEALNLPIFSGKPNHNNSYTEKKFNCYMSGIECSDKVPKINEHNHFNGKYMYRGAACQSCNTKKGKDSKIIPVFFHHGSG
jgi:hypothetical protein